MGTLHSSGDPSKKPGDKAAKPAPRAGEDDLELRPLQRLNADLDDQAETPVLETAAATPVAQTPPAPAPTAPGMKMCPSCSSLKPQDEFTPISDGRTLCRECATDYKRRHGREESRIAAAAAEGSGAWFDLPDAAAWLMTVIMPVGAYVVFFLLMTLMRRTHSLGLGSPGSDALLLLAVMAVQAVIVLAALAIASTIFGGLDLPSVPNILWKVLGVLIVDVAVFVWFVSAWQTVTCMLPVYIMLVRPLFMGIALVFLLGLEIVEGAIATVIAWAAIWLLLLSAVARGFFFTGLPGSS